MLKEKETNPGREKEKSGVRSAKPQKMIFVDVGVSMRSGMVILGILLILLEILVLNYFFGLFGIIGLILILIGIASKNEAELAQIEQVTETKKLREELNSFKNTDVIQKQSDEIESLKNQLNELKHSKRR